MRTLIALCLSLVIGTGHAWVAPTTNPNLVARGTMASDIVVGSAKAPVEVIEYASLTCGHCAEMAANGITQMMKFHVATGKVRYVFRHFLLNHADFVASKLARCAGPAGFHRMTDLFFREQPSWLNEGYEAQLKALAIKGGLTPARIEACLTDKAIEDYLLKSTELGATEWNVNSTPTTIINGEKQRSGEIPWPELQQMIETKLREGGK